MTWDALAPYWHLFEGDGFGTSTIAALVADGITAPLVLVGAGIGTYAAMLRDQVGDAVAVDRSTAMMRRAAVEHDLRCIVGDGTSLPLADASLATAICATGVIESLSSPERIKVLRELARVAARVYVCAFAAPHREGPPAIEIRPVLDRSRAGEPIARFDLLAAELGDRERAYQLLVETMPAYEVVIDELDFADDALGAGLRVHRIANTAPPGTMLWRLDRR
jgi:hypothetical protein